MDRISRMELHLKYLLPWTGTMVLGLLVTMGLNPKVHANPTDLIITNPVSDAAERQNQSPLALRQSARPPISSPKSESLSWQPIAVSRVNNSNPVNQNQSTQRTLAWQPLNNNPVATSDPSKPSLHWQPSSRTAIIPLNSPSVARRDSSEIKPLNSVISRNNRQNPLEIDSSYRGQVISQPTVRREIPVLAWRDSNDSSTNSNANYRQTLQETPVIFQRDYRSSVNSNNSDPRSLSGYHRTLAEIPLISQRDFTQVIGLNGVSSSNNHDSASTATETNRNLIAQNQPPVYQPDLQEIRRLQTELKPENLEQRNADLGYTKYGSPSLSILNPIGYGADNYTLFTSGVFMSRTRYGDEADGAWGLGVGLGDARKYVGVELSYAMVSFGGSRDFGAGGFNAKIHRVIQPDLAMAVGINGFANIGGDNDFENSVYGVITKIFKTRDDISLPFSRVAVSAGLGTGQFRSEGATEDDINEINAFGSVAVRIVEPVSLITEWTGQDLALGVSIAPFKNVPLVITPAVRDIVGAGDGPRFVLGIGFAHQF